MIGIPRIGGGPRARDQMDDSELYARVRRCLGAELALFGSSSPRAHLLERPGILAAVSPETPERSLFNAVMCDSLVALEPYYEELADCYRAAGVHAWTVWSDPGDTELTKFLAARGHVHDAQPLAMAAEIQRMALPDATDLDWFETRDMQLVATLNDLAWRAPSPTYTTVFRSLDDPRWRAYAARHDGTPACCLLLWDGDYGDAGIAAVATVPEAQGRGLASRLLAQALRDAQARGLLTTSMQASPAGRPVYLRLNYRELGAMGLWERRSDQRPSR